MNTSKAAKLANRRKLQGSMVCAIMDYPVPGKGPAREALLSRTYFFVANWAWYEWVGVFAPLVILWWFSSADVRGARPVGLRVPVLLHIEVLDALDVTGERSAREQAVPTVFIIKSHDVIRVTETFRRGHSRIE